MATIVDLTEAKAHLNITGSASDDEITDLLDSATERVRELAQVYDVGTYTELLWVSGGSVNLSHTPVVAVTSVTSAGEAITGTTVNSYGLLSGLSGWRQVTVTYTAGTAVPEARVHTAILMVTARLWETQRGGASGPLGSADGQVFTPGLQGILGEVRALLGSSGGLGIVA
jgi:hypothetical protein